MLVSKASCCCSAYAVRAGAIGWGSNCEQCPLFASDEYDDLCADVTGLIVHKFCFGIHVPYLWYSHKYLPRTDLINECVTYSNICGTHGFCEDLVDGYRCVCEAGYRYDEARHEGVGEA